MTAYHHDLCLEYNGGRVGRGSDNVSPMGENNVLHLFPMIVYLVNSDLHHVHYGLESVGIFLESVCALLVSASTYVFLANVCIYRGSATVLDCTDYDQGTYVIWGPVQPPHE